MCQCVVACSSQPQGLDKWLHKGWHRGSGSKLDAGEGHFNGLVR